MLGGWDLPSRRMADLCDALTDGAVSAETLISWDADGDLRTNERV